MLSASHAGMINLYRRLAKDQEERCLTEPRDTLNGRALRRTKAMVPTSTNQSSADFHSVFLKALDKSGN